MKTSIMLVILSTGCAAAPSNPLAVPPKVGKELNIQTKGECTTVPVELGRGWDDIYTSECNFVVGSEPK